MATTRAPKKSPAKKTPARKIATKKAPARTSTHKKRSTTKVQSTQSFRVEQSTTPFFTIAITRQTVYWTILSAAVLALGLWILHLQNEINKIYDAIDVSMIESETAIVNSAPKKQ